MAKKAKTSKKPRTTDAIALLKADHRAVEKLFAAFESASGAARKEKIACKICMELAIHAQVEEELLYPACRGAVDDDMLDEAYVEHDGAKTLIAEIVKGDARDAFYDAKVTVLAEMIKHHVKEEEQRDGLFAQAKAADIDLRELGRRIAERKAELAKTFGQTGIPTPVTRSMKGIALERGHPAEAPPAN